MSIDNLRLAVLIDGDNAPRDCLKGIMEEIAIYGTPMIKRIYGDWASHGLTSWKNTLLENAVTPKQQFAYTTGKNATDSAMIIDAMDILYTGKTDGYVLVSSDSDFTPLAIRLRESGMYVIGIGEEKTPKAFVQACDKFIRVEVIRDKYKKPAKAAARSPPPRLPPRRPPLRQDGRDGGQGPGQVLGEEDGRHRRGGQSRPCRRTSSTSSPTPWPTWRTTTAGSTCPTWATSL